MVYTVLLKEKKTKVVVIVSSLSPDSLQASGATATVIDRGRKHQRKQKAGAFSQKLTPHTELLTILCRYQQKQYPPLARRNNRPPSPCSEGSRPRNDMKPVNVFSVYPGFCLSRLLYKKHGIYREINAFGCTICRSRTPFLP